MENGVSLETKIQWYESSAEMTLNARKLSERDRDYYDHKQWTEKERSDLAKRGQAAITINRVQPKIDFLIGLEQMRRRGPKAFPRTPIHEDAANAATDALRYVTDAEMWDGKRSESFANLTIEGTCGAEVIVKKNAKGEMVIVLNNIMWDRLFYDPHSRRKDFSDANYLGTVTWMDLDDAKEKWPGEDKEQALDASLVPGDLDETYEDTPRISWGDNDRKRVRIIEMYYKHKGMWYRCVFTKGGILEAAKKSFYLDEDGIPECPLIFQSAKVDREGNRYGFVRTLIDPQDEVNKRRSKGLHFMSLRQTAGEKGAVKDIQKMKRELSKADGHVEYMKGFDWKILDTNDMAAAQFSMMQEAKREIDDVGANASLTGKEEKAQSGRALEARGQAGQVELGPLFDMLSQFDHRVYRSIWNRIKQFWGEEKWIRVTDDENNLEWVGLNAPVTVGDMWAQHQQRIQNVDPAQQEQATSDFIGMMQEKGVNYQDPNAVFTVANNVAELDVDIIIEDVPDVVSLQQEQFAELARLYPSVPEQYKIEAFEMIIEASSIRNKDRMLGKKKGGEEAAKQAQDQAAELIEIEKQAKVVDIENKVADTDKKKSETMENMAQIQKVVVDTSRAPVQ